MVSDSKTILTGTVKDSILQYHTEVNRELVSILTYWMEHTVDDEQGGFYGKIDNDNTIHHEAPKGAVLNSRILWTFSAAYLLTNHEDYLRIADRAYQYIVNHFIDKEWGGVYWSTDYKGVPLDTKKQIYAIAFAIYGLSEYVKCTKNEAAKEQAIQLYHSIEEHSHDSIHKGYLEALTRDWKEIEDLRLSPKDLAEKKSMNTHLHILEAYSNLYLTWPDATLKNRIEELLELFLNNIIDKNTYHLLLFFDEAWHSKSSIISYGHDIETAWLLQEAAEIIGNKVLLERIKEVSVKIAEAAARGLDKDGGLWYENEGEHLIKEKHWWPQAEAMVGFYNAWQLTGTLDYLQHSLHSWNFIKEHILDTKKGEWFWGVKEDYSIMQVEDKTGLWKCPYHNGRACLELIRRTKL